MRHVAVPEPGPLCLPRPPAARLCLLVSLLRPDLPALQRLRGRRPLSQRRRVPDVGERDVFLRLHGLLLGRQLFYPGPLPAVSVWRQGRMHSGECVWLFVGCLTSQQHASVFQGRIPPPPLSLFFFVLVMTYSAASRSSGIRRRLL